MKAVIKSIPVVSSQWLVNRLNVSFSAILRDLALLNIFFVSLFIILVCPANAHTNETFTHGTKGPTITVRRPAAEKISKFQSDKHFKYDEKAQTQDNWWQEFLHWLWKHLAPKSSVDPKFGSASFWWGMIELIIIAAAVVLFIYFILKSQGVSLFSKNSGPALAFTESQEDISQMNFDELIAKAAANGQYRQAVRYLYLKSLKQLSDLDLIKWKAEKTNRDYTIELRSSPFSNVFSEITMLFDYAWYGNASINENTFTRIKSAFEQFNRQATLRN